MVYADRFVKLFLWSESPVGFEEVGWWHHVQRGSHPADLFLKPAGTSHRPGHDTATFCICTPFL
jgi:hypothetical protein